MSTGGKDSDPEVVEVRIWNDTVANLTLMALGSSAPEILLSCIEIVGNNFNAGDLGPGTIVGSAAFNLLVICAVCIMAIPGGETRTIRLFNVSILKFLKYNLIQRKTSVYQPFKFPQVFLITTVFSLFAYIWLLVILQFISPDVVDIWEAVLTFLFFPILVLLAWWADRGFSFGKRTPVVTDQQIELGMANGSPGGECKWYFDFGFSYYLSPCYLENLKKCVRRCYADAAVL